MKMRDERGIDELISKRDKSASGSAGVGGLTVPNAILHQGNGAHSVSIHSENLDHDNGSNLLQSSLKNKLFQTQANRKQLQLPSINSMTREKSQTLKLPAQPKKMTGSRENKEALSLKNSHSNSSPLIKILQGNASNKSNISNRSHSHHESPVH